MQPNAEPAKIDPEVSKNVQQIKEVTGAAVKVSSFLVSTLCTLTVQLGKQLSPVVRSQGAKVTNLYKLLISYRFPSVLSVKIKITQSNFVYPHPLQRSFYARMFAIMLLC